MKAKLYPVRVIGVLSFLLFFQENLSAQCNCSPGVPATPVTYYFILDTTNAPSTTISFPKFDPAIGTLSCISFNDTLSLVSISEVENTAAVPVTYRFLLSVTNQIDGPGISIFEPASRNYGPSLLAKYLDPGYNTTYGPDTLFQSSTHQNGSSDIASYLGSSGTVDFVYTVNGGLISQQGGISYAYEITSKYWGAFSLTYYWCPNTALNIKNRTFPKPERAPATETGNSSLTLYPNPAINQFSVSFNKAVTGDFTIEMINMAGQTILNRFTRLNNARFVQINLNNLPPPGMYYLKAIDRKSGTTYINKLFIKG